METNNREARRRRIADRGSDRLALITGRIQTLPSSSTSLEPEPHHSQTASCPPSIFDDHHDFRTHLSDQPPVPPHNEDKSSRSLLPKHDTTPESGQFNASDGGSKTQPLLRKCETCTETLRAPAWEADGRVESSPISSTVQNSSISASDMEHHFQPVTHSHKIFSSSQISSAITASESIRFYCSVAVAILVVLSYVGFPIIGSLMRSIIMLRPLYLLLLTNISIVLAQLLLEKQRGFERVQQEANNDPSMGEYGMVEQVSKALELGLVLQNIMGALFMDSSVYAIVVICGLSLAQRLGW
ncbi:hypothetical protein F0562_012438 [Nyssa sinensis]|uniref:Uncharacterized protein n=1 Tax=Nyssa sinensis TaxID=561372 RepID=A0A5J4ZSP6_9ASTE|nr:hypothetical protein F0562_012438 [Nyssa sinensis]